MSAISSADRSLISSTRRGFGGMIGAGMLLAGGVKPARSAARRGGTLRIATHSQSTNDTFPTVMHVATLEQTEGLLLPAVEVLRRTFAAKAEEFRDVVMVGRTHLQDAAPITLGQVISGWVESS